MDSVLLVLTLVSLAAAVGFGVVTWRALGDQRRRSAARVAALSAAIRGGDEPAAPVAVSSLFTRDTGAAVNGRPLIKAAVVGTLGVGLIVFVTMATSRDSVERALQPAVSEETAPLELMNMRHTRDGATLTVTGLVRNPQAGAQVSRIAAVVFAFDRDGGFVASARAPLDFTTLAPGDESPFVVTVPNVAAVGRYRVSFRTDAGVIRHVDRRAAAQLALSN